MKIESSGNEVTDDIPITGAKSEHFGSIKSNFYLNNFCFKPSFGVYDAKGEHIFNIKKTSSFSCGKLCAKIFCGDFMDTTFTIFDLNDTEVGKIVKQGCKSITDQIKQAFTDADNFSVSFPIDLDVRMKAVLVMGVFLIDFMFFEEPAGKE